MTPPCGPVLVSVPVDDWEAETVPVPQRLVSRSMRPDPATLALIGEALDAAERPVLVVGGAVDRDDAFGQVVALAERHNARVFVAPMTGRCNFPENHRLFAGFLPAIRERIVARLQGADLVFVVGAPAFTYHVEGFGPHIPAGARLAQLIDDPHTAAWTPEGVVAIGGVRLGLVDLLARAPPPARPAPPPREAVTRAEATTPMTTAFVLQTLAELKPAETIVVEEAPSARPVMQARLPITRSEGFYTMDSGGLGWGLPAAVGVALGKGARIAAILGDGSSLYSIQALWSAAQLKLPIAVLILNNGGYAALREFAPVFGFGAQEPVPGVDLPGLDFVALARGFGCPARRARTPDELASALREALGAAGPMLVEAMVKET